MMTFEQWCKETFSEEFLKNAEKEYEKAKKEGQKLREEFEKRAAIIEFYDGMTREEAEKVAFKDIYGFDIGKS
jgi:hypothetical protein